MKKTFFSITIGTALCFAPALNSFAQANNSELYLPNVSVKGLNQNGFTGIVGGIFYSPYYYNANVNYLGYADPNDAPLVDSHTVTIWGAGGNAASGSVAASAVVPAGVPTLWANGYAWVALPSTVTLTYQSYYVIGATVVGGVDTWGDLIQNSSPDNGNNGPINWNVVNGSWGGDPNSPYVQAGSGWEFSRQGIYDYNTSDAGNPNPSYSQSGASDSIYPAPNPAFNLTFPPVPEPATWGFATPGAVAWLLAARQRKN